MKEIEGVRVIERDLETNPKCRHGPTILFSSKNRKYFTCSFDHSKGCFFMNYENFEKNKKEIMSSQNFMLKEPSETIDLRKILPTERFFCITCNFVIISPTQHDTSHKIKHISEKMLKDPSLFLPQLNNDKANAQYFFDETTLNFINSIFDVLNFTNIICLGAPRLHDFLRSKAKNSILLDIDNRFQPFYPDMFCHYNMLNNYFFKGHKDGVKLEEFLKANNFDEKSRHCLVTDPPFAARTELLSQTLSSISTLYFKLTQKILPIFWIFPYFNEYHVTKFMPQMEMMDYKVTYMNHYAFNDQYKGRKEGSVVRIFTNVPLNLIKYPSNFVNYRYCKLCDKYVSKNNKHCQICKTCPAKNGSTYNHCHACVKCVKPNYVHCENCGRCTQKIHDCKIYQTHQECYLCDKKGHVEKFCQFMRKIRAKGKRGRCCVCNGEHNLKFCPEKYEILNKQAR